MTAGKQTISNRFFGGGQLPLGLLVILALLVSACDAQSPLDSQPVRDVASAKQADAVATPAGTPHDGVYVLIGKRSLPQGLARDVEAAGGTLTQSFPEIGVAFAKAADADFQSRAAGIKGLESVVPDLIIDWVDDPQLDGAPAEVGGPAADEEFSFLQWPLEAINAEGAWAQGVTGAGVRVAIIDGGIYDKHVDLTDQIDRDASRSFVPPSTTPYWDWNQENPGNTFWHGTHVAGIVAADDNGIGTIGVAPGATLIGVKALHAYDNGSGSGAFSWIINAIYYAGTPLAEGGAGADIINMSLGATLDEKDRTDDNKEAVRELRKAIDRATRYAWQQGALVVVSAGNGSTDFDQERTLLKVPAQNQHAMSVSATGPIGWARGANNPTSLAYYSDYGKSLVDIAAPGGTFGLAIVEDDFSSCTVDGPTRSITTLCAYLDGYISTVRGPSASTAFYNWSQGTSMAAPTVAGVAALVAEQAGTGNPAYLMSRIQSSALDLGKPGQDAVYGHGFVNAEAAVRTAVAAERGSR